MDPEPSATLTLDGKPIEDWLRTVIREELDAAVARALAQLMGIVLGKTPTVEATDVRGMTCAQATTLTGKPCKGQCTHDASDPVLPSTIADPDCFR